MGAAATGCSQTGGANWGEILGGLGTAPGGLDETTIVAGLQDALRVGTRNAVQITGRENGFWGNPLIRIPIPDSLRTMATGLRAVGLGPQVDELELSMNRAAERASGEATDVFLGAIASMTFADARGILEGDDTAATEYFRRRTGDELRARFEPIVTEKMNQVGLARLYADLSARYAALPFTTAPALDLSSYVTQEALDGLFATLAEQEREIRRDPAARTTELLRRVFGSVSPSTP